MGIDTESIIYKDLVNSWRLPVAIYGGTETMRAAREAYLPKEPQEHKDDYDARLKRSYLSNFFKPAVLGASAKIFQKPIVVDGLSNDGWLQDIDMQGSSVTEFFNAVFKESCKLGVSYVLADSPPLEGVRNLSEQRASNIRPYLIHVKPHDLIDWEIEEINNVRVLTMIKIKQVVYERDEDGEQKEVQKIRIIEKAETGCTFRVYRMSEGGNEELESEGTIGSDEIPLVPYYTNKTGEMCAEPFFNELIWENLAHWQSASDQSNILHVVRVPRLVVKDFDDEAMQLLSEHGVARFIAISGENADAFWLEAKGEAIQHGERDLQAREEKMRALSLDPLIVQRTGSQTATSKSIDEAKANSVIMDWALSLSQCVKDAIGFMLVFAGESGEIDVTVNDDYSIISDAHLKAKEVRELYALAVIRDVTLLKEYKRLGLLDDDFDVDAEVGLVTGDNGLFGGGEDD